MHSYTPYAACEIAHWCRSVCPAITPVSLTGPAGGKVAADLTLSGVKVCVLVDPLVATAKHLMHLGASLEAAQGVFSAGEGPRHRHAGRRARAREEAERAEAARPKKLLLLLRNTC